MLQEQSRLFQRILFFVDIALVVVGWTIAYFIRFELLVPPEYVTFASYLRFVPWVLLLSLFVFWATGLYQPSKALRVSSLIFAVLKSTFFGFILVAASLSFYRAFSFSRLMFLLFGVITPILMVSSRWLLYLITQRGRDSAQRLQRVLVYGAGELGHRLVDSFRNYPWTKIELVGFVDDSRTDSDEILGTGEDLLPLIDRFEQEGRRVDYVYLALPLSAASRIESALDKLSKRLVHVCLVPDLFQFNLLNARVSDVDGMHVIHLIDQAPPGFGHGLKRLVDIIGSAFLLILLSPLLLLLAIGTKLSSPGPVFYRQRRMGLNGQEFDMIKFRSMPVGSEKQSGPVWASPDEKRATAFGSFIRRTSLDELPQFWNVLKGEMSIVGPRPERPVFIEQFKENVPLYMLRHKTKAGITGWAQVNGWRGNTSLEKRIEYDLYYIQNWSLLFDFKIMLMTISKGFVNENAY